MPLRGRCGFSPSEDEGVAEVFENGRSKKAAKS